MERISYQVIRSARRTVAIQITGDARVLVRCPYGMGKEQIQSFVEKKMPWIQKHLNGMSAKREPLNGEALKELASQAAEQIPKRVALFAPLVGVTYGRITIRHQRTRWGSCSGKGNLNFNCLLMLAPAEVLDYVVVHELCHRKEMNHSSQFWAEVERVCPDYRTHRKWLKQNGISLLR